MKKLLKSILTLLATLLLISCGSNLMDSEDSKLSTTGISLYTTSAGFGKPASEAEIAAMIPKIDSYFSGQYASNPKALMGAQSNVIAQVATTAVAKPVFRFYNSNTSAHFYTMSEAERDYVKQTFPFFSFEGEQFYAYPDVDPALSPVYRFYNQITATHFYTINAEEKDYVIATWPQIFNYEGIAWHASKTEGNGWIPVYRFFNHKTGTHFYTANAAEKDHIIATWDWFRFEGIAYYAESATYTGKIIDGYIRGAAVFWDCNDNLKFDPTEIKTTSGFAGSYSIGAKPNANCVLRAIVPATAIDEDTNKAIGVPMVLSSIPGKPQLISPLTTPVGIGAMTEVDVLTLLNGTTLSLTDDYIAAGSAGVQNHNAARYVAATLKAISGQISTDNQEVRAALLSKAMSQLPQSAWTTKTPLEQVIFENYFTDNWGLGLIDPFAPFLTKQSFMLDQDAILALPVSQRVAAQAAVQKALDAINSRPDMVAGGVIVWGALPQSVRSTFAPTLADTNIFPETTEVAQLRAVLIAESIKAQAAIKAAENESRYKQRAQLLKSATDASLTSLNTAATVVAPATRAMIKKAKIAQVPKVLKTKITALKNLRKYITVVNDYANCASFFTRLPNLLDSMEGNVSFLVEDMIPWGLEGVTCINTLAGSEKMGAALEKASGYASIAAGTLSFADAKEYVQFQSALDDIVLAILDLASLDVPRAILAEMDLIIIKRVTMAIDQHEAADAADAAMQIVFDNVSAEFKLFADEMRDKLLSARLMPYIRPIATECATGFFVSNGRCIDNPAVTNITPATATLNTATVFNVTGTNLPSTAILAVADATCQNPVNNTATGFTQSCTMGATAGAKAITVKTATGGAVIDNTRSVNISTQSVGLLNPSNGHRYEVITCGAWAQCDAAAKAKGGNLVTIRSAAENTWLLNNVFSASSEVMFIGLYKTGSTWSWSSGEPVAFTAWLAGNPDNYLGNQNYAHLSIGNRLWDDVADAFYGAATQAILEYIPQTSTFSVPANLPAGTQFIVPSAVNSCVFTATGTWNNATSNFTPVGTTTVMPSQYPSYYTWPMYTSPFFSLIAMKSGIPFYIGNQATLSVISGQSLSFVANDSYYSNSFSDNSGALSVSYSCSNTPASAGSITVAANTIPGGTFQVPAGATSCQLSATGTWSAGPNAPISAQTADGVVGGNALDLVGRGVPLPSAPVNSLVAQHSSTGIWELVGSSKTLTVSPQENLRFMMNDATDGGYTDGNTGSLVVSYSCN